MAPRVYIFVLMCLALGFPLAHSESPVRALLKENRLEEALPICRQFEQLSSSMKDNLLVCTWVYLRSDRIESAEKLIAQLASSETLPEFQLATAYLRLKKKQFNEARRIVSRLQSQSAGTLVEVSAEEMSAEIYEAMGQPDTAAFLYKQVLEREPDRARSHWGLGRYYLARNEPARSIPHLEQTAKMWPKHINSRYNLGVVYLGQDNLVDAARWFVECYKIDKADPDVQEHLGLLFEKKGYIDDAVRHWQKALALKKDMPVSRDKLEKYFSQTIDNLIANKQYNEALKKLASSNLKIAENPPLLLRRGIAYRYLNKFDKGAGDLKSYLAQIPGDPLALRELGICYVNLRLIDNAEVHFRRAVEQAPEEGLNHAWLGYVLESRGKLAEAKEHWAKAVEFFRDPVELEKATRRLASLEKRVPKGETSSKKRKKNLEEEFDGGEYGEPEE